MAVFISPNSKMVSVLISPSSGSTPASVQFATQEDLQDRKIIGIETYGNQDLQYDPNNSGVPLITDLVFGNCFLTLYTSAVNNRTFYGKTQQPGLFYDKIPMPSLRRCQNNISAAPNPVSFVNDVFLIRPTELAFNKCKVEVPTPTVLATQVSAVFMFHYLDKGDDGEWWMRAMGYANNGSK